MSNLLEHATNEFNLLGGLTGEDEAQKMMCENILDLLKIFSDQGHTGFTGNYCLNLFDRLARFKPIGPLTGQENEGIEYADDEFQNKRDGEVFKKGKDGKAYWTSGRVFVDKDGSAWTNIDSRVFIEFPWTRPDKPEYIHRDE